MARIEKGKNQRGKRGGSSGEGKAREKTQERRLLGEEVIRYRHQSSGTSDFAENCSLTGEGEKERETKKKKIARGRREGSQETQLRSLLSEGRKWIQVEARTGRLGKGSSWTKILARALY